MKATRTTRALLAVAWLLIAAACSRQTSVQQVTVAGGDAGGMPRAQPAEEHFEAAALEQVSTDPAASGLQALVVLRHGHIVFDRYGHGVNARSVEDLGDFAKVLLALATGIAVHDDVLPLPARSPFDPVHLRDAIEGGSHQKYADYLSLHLWRRLNAAPARIDLKSGTEEPADCCFHAQLIDWMRVAELLVQDGHFEGKQLVPAGWIARMRQPVVADGSSGFGIQLPPSAHGAEVFGADDVFFLRGPKHWRLWLVPGLQMAVLFGSDVQDAAAGQSTWDETRVLNLVLRAIADPPKPNDASLLHQLVPGH